MRRSHKALLALTVIALVVGIANGVLDIYVKAAQTFQASAVTPYGEDLKIRIRCDSGRPPLLWTLAWRVSGTEVTTVTNAVTITVTGSNVASTATVDYYVKAVSDSDPSKWTKTLQGSGVSVSVGGSALENTTGAVDIDTHLQDLGVSTTQDQTVNYYVYVKVTATGLISGDTLTAEIVETLFDSVTYDYGVVSSGSATLTPPTMDAYVDQRYPGTNLGTYSDLDVREVADKNKITYLAFDLSSIPDGADVTLAQLKLYCYYHDGNVASYVRRVTSDWTETGITWNSQPSYTTVGQATKTWSLGWSAATVTSIVEAWVEDGAANYGFRVEPQETASTDQNLFYSKEKGDYQPQLYVEYDSYDWTANWWRLPPLSITATPAGQQILACIAAVIAGAVAVGAIKRRKRRRRR